MIVEVLSIYLTIIMASTVLLLLLIVMAACLQQYATQPIIMEAPSNQFSGDLHLVKRQTGYENIPLDLLENCAEKFSFDNLLLVGTNISSLAAKLDPCPCTREQAFHDLERYVEQRDRFQCYVSAVPLETHVITSRINLTQQCCYNTDGFLQVSPDDGYVGTFLLFHPHLNENDYELRDESFRDECCEVGFDMLCKKFMDKRVAGSCVGYVPPPDLDQRIKNKVCEDTVNVDSLLFLGTSPTETSEKLDPCPCSRVHAEEDDRFVQQSGSIEFCFISSSQITMDLPVLQLTVTQQCCYHKNGSLNTLPRGERTGSMLVHHPHTDRENYMFVDQSFKKQCCRIDSDTHCKMFYNRRIINKCDGYLTTTELEFQRQTQICLQSVAFQQFLILFEVADAPSELAEMLNPCPCTKYQAESDIGNVRKQIGLPHQCYISTNPVEYNSFLFRLTLTQQCCYGEEGALMTSSEDGYPGTLLLHHPVYDSNSYEAHDRSFRSECCEIGSMEHCSIFLSQRPINTCVGYQLPNMNAYVQYGPHFQTFDGKFFDFNGEGDFVILETDAFNLFTVQNRGAILPFAPRQTFNIAFAFGLPDLAFQFGPGFRLLQTRPNVIELTPQLSFSGSTLEFGDEAQLTREDNTITAAFYKTGIVLSLSTMSIRDYFIANCQSSVPISFFATTKGLWGNFDGDNSNDLYRRGETTPLPNNLNGVQLYSHLLTWRVAAEESLFSN